MRWIDVKTVGLMLGTMLLLAAGAWADEPIRFDSDPYLTGQFYASEPVAVEGEPVRLHLEPMVTESAGIEHLRGVVFIKDRHGQVVHEAEVAMHADETFRASVAWTPEANGLYSARAVLRDADAGGDSKLLASADLVLPVRVEEREVNFVWYNVRESRWATVFTVTAEEKVRPLKRRGITALDWAAGPMQQRMPADRSEWDALIEDKISRWARYAEENEHGYDGVGLDEFGGFAGTEKYEKTDAFLREMARQRKALHEGGVIASWHAGGMPLEWASLHRMSADFILIELYLLGYFPPTTGTEEIYGMIDTRVNTMREREMFVPSWGGRATSLIALDSNMKHGLGHYHPGEIENVVRYLRRVAPEMRGLALYNGSGGRGEAQEAMKQRNWALFDDLFLKYFIKPVVTLQRGGLWVEDGEVVIALSNIGAMDSGAVTVELWREGEPWKTVSAERAPAGFSRHDNRALIRVPWEPGEGLNRLEARITESAFGAVLDASIEREVFVPTR